ncbi:MAG: FlxA-like family protein [Lachnospiraceae bacterium]|nr:FlxA-like family protein [Lachnospiraceae bacterium]
MKINGLNGNNTQIGRMNGMQANDAVSKNIQSQIVNAQKQLQELSANKEMSMEEKMKKRQEIQQQITDLNNQLRQHQMEQRKEKQQPKGSAMEDLFGGSKNVTPKAGKKSSGLSLASMTAIISADSAMAQAQIQGSVSGQMEGKAGVLEAEIKLDSARGGDVEKKKEELAEVQEKASEAETAQLNTLSDANKKLEEAAKADRQAEKTDDKDKKTDKKTAVSNEKEDKVVEDIEQTKIADITENAEEPTSDTVTYTHVDVRL